MDRGGGGTGIEGAESGVEGAGSGSRGGGKRGQCGRGSGKIGGRNCFFFTSKFIIKRFITIPFKTYKSYKDLKGCSSLSSLRFRVISGVLANLMVSVHIYQSQYWIASL